MADICSIQPRQKVQDRRSAIRWAHLLSTPGLLTCYQHQALRRKAKWVDLETRATKWWISCPERGKRPALYNWSRLADWQLAQLRQIWKEKAKEKRRNIRWEFLGLSLVRIGYCKLREQASRVVSYQGMSIQQRGWGKLDPHWMWSTYSQKNEAYPGIVLHTVLDYTDILAGVFKEHKTDGGPLRWAWIERRWDSG